MGFVLLSALAACTEPGADSRPGAGRPDGGGAPALAALPSLNSPGDTVGTPPAVGDADNLVGLDRASLERLFGRPSLRRQEGPAEVWQYSARDCVMDAYLYAASGGDDLRQVTYVEFREGGLGVLGEGKARERCLVDVLAAGQRDAAR